ncbi:alanine racemase [Vibrio albus]|uniref:Alanine racemase n=1 Tax=Vibrio albus TaxID=2200953 RepID=A0A2U3B9A0_9VIBR|nr:alanine racemase [Vibrio albus]PWI33370.1 alanine racemase [Vibrio albus]
MVTAEAVVDLEALRHNYQFFKNRCKASKVVAVIKGDAYGHGAVEVAKALDCADMFAVSRIEEGIWLREAGITQPVLLLEGCFCADDLTIAAKEGFETLIHHPEQLRDIETAELEKPIKVWLKLDTGMHRLGVHAEEVADYVDRLRASKNVDGEPGFASHFSCADDLNSPTTQSQLERFLAMTAPYPGEKTLANSAGALYWPEAHFDYARVGIALYGISPDENQTGKEQGLKPVMTLKSKLIAVREHKAGDPVGYGEIWHSGNDTRLGVIAMGYGDGYPRLAPEGTPVWVNGRIVHIVGRVSMDMLTVDLGADATDKAGDEVELWGNHLPVEQVARHIGTIPYELVIKLTKRVCKNYF